MVTAEVINIQYAEAKEKFSKLNSPEQGEMAWRISGAIDVIDDNGWCWATYEVAILIPNEYPDKLPELVETGGKIVRHDDWHNTDGLCCLSTSSIMFSQLFGRMTLLNWLQEFAYPFLANHVFKIETGDYANGEFDHRNPGILQGYFILFETSDVKEVIERLKLMSGVKPIGLNAKCFCGSGKRYKDCYLSKIEQHTLGIPLRVLKYDLNAILVYLRGKRKMTPTDS